LTVVEDSLEQLNITYRKETDADVKERILFVRRLESKVTRHQKYLKGNYTGPGGGWAYKWLDSFDKQSIDGLKDKQRRDDRLLLIKENKILKIRQKIFENKSGWLAKQASNDIVYKRHE
jgi:hypothetical protein